MGRKVLSIPSVLCSLVRRLSSKEADPGLLASQAERHGCVLRSLVAMMDDVCRPPLANRHVHGIDDELRLDVVAHRPTHDAARPSIQDDGQVDEACPGWHVGDICHPELVRRVCSEVAVNQIVGWPDPVVADRGACSLATADADQSRRFHQPFDPLAADTDAIVSEFCVDPGRAIGLLRRAVDLGNQPGQTCRPARRARPCP